MSNEFEAWELRARLALAHRNVDVHTADPLVADAREHWLAAGVPPEQALGSPDEFATEAVAQQPAGHDAQLDRTGSTPRSHLGAAAFQLALMTVPLSLAAAWVAGSWTVDVTPARAVAAGLFVLVAVVLLGGPEGLRAAGRPALAPWALAAALGGMAVTVAALEVLPGSPSLPLPVVLLTLAAAVAAVALVWGPSPPRTLPVDATGTDPEQWSRRLSGLLVGRHDVPPERAAQLVAETREHAGSADPGAEFGPAETYAAELAAGVEQRVQPRWLVLRLPLLLAFCVLLTRSQLDEVLADGGGWRAAALAVLLATALLLLARALVRRTQRRRDSGSAAATG